LGNNYEKKYLNMDFRSDDYYLDDGDDEDYW